MTSKLARVLVWAAMGAGALGVILALAGVHSPVRTVLVLLFLAVAPTAAIAGLLHDFDPFARLILAVLSTVLVLSIVSMILLSAGLWSPTGQLLGVAAFTVGCLALQRPSVRARLAAWVRPRWQALLRHVPGTRAAAPAAGTAAAPAAETTAGADTAGSATAPAAWTAAAPAAETASETAGGADTAGPTEATTPLPAIRD